jgi:hypothetical protein
MYWYLACLISPTYLPTYLPILRTNYIAEYMYLYHHQVSLWYSVHTVHLPCPVN